MKKSNDVAFIELNNQIAKLKQELINEDEFLSYAHHELNGFVHNIHFLSDYLCKKKIIKLLKPLLMVILKD